MGVSGLTYSSTCMHRADFKARVQSLRICTMSRVVKPKTKRGLRELEKRAPKLEENVKKLLLLHGTTTSSVVKGVLMDFYRLRKAGGNAIKYTKRNEKIRPFETGGENYLEFLSQRTDCSLFVFGSCSKKRPHNLVVGRMYDHHVYDLIEIGVERFEPIIMFGGGKKNSPQEGSKPCFVFIGEGFEQDEKIKHLKEILIDVLRGEVVTAINLAGLDRVFLCIAIGNKVRKIALAKMKGLKRHRQETYSGPVAARTPAAASSPSKKARTHQYGEE